MILGSLLAFAVGIGGLFLLPGEEETGPNMISQFESPAIASPTETDQSAESSTPLTADNNLLQTPTVLALKTSAVTDDSCREDLECWGGRNSMQAAFHCNSAVEQQTARPFRWTHSFGSPKFDSFRWHNEEAGQVVYQGSRFEVQGSNGQWSARRYECAFDPHNNQVLTLQVSAAQS
ncbi:hypothetical protein ACTL6U_06290 [Rhodovibrionaceae bacterium A322]